MKPKKKKSALKRFFIWLIKIGICLFCFTLVQVAVFKFVNPPFTINMVYEWGLFKIRKHNYQRPRFEWQDLNKISPHLRKAVLASEDQRFLSHKGFDFEEIKIVLENAAKDQKIRGASTISMQAARSLFLFSSRNISRKIAEAYYTVLIELVWDKNRILEVYLNTVDWGHGVIGAEAAAKRYFSIPSKKLDARQAALLAAVLPSPHRWSVVNPSPYVVSRQKRILRDMRLMPLIGK
ncbi:MAG: monofunctional biosynthetic peptidoglycan transglycosylase [Desulfobacteraceae bacterium]|nr:monofunctional biosynthetic peptidoglycan transglycosylase [Desulfobacteraceae bacterium]